jgi:hypothetical protein
MSDDIKARLRRNAKGGYGNPRDQNEAADRIEALEAEVARLRDADAAFERVWSIVKNWDISTEPGPCRLYEGINGDHVSAIVRAALDDQPTSPTTETG